MSEKISVLFICQHNSGRSQIAAAYLQKFAGEHLTVESAGLEPAERVNPLVVEVMKEEGVDLSGIKPRSVFELFKEGKIYAHVITVCHDTEDRCPIFPGITQRWHWPFPDPAKVEGTEEEKLAQVREIRDAIKKWLLDPGDGIISFQRRTGPAMECQMLSVDPYAGFSVPRAETISKYCSRTSLRYMW